MNNVVLIGRLTKDPEIKYLQSGIPVANFSLAIDKQLPKEKKQELESKGEPTADFVNIVAWNKTAENCANHLTKGLKVAIQGRIQTRSYQTNDGAKRYITEIVAERTEFLEWKNEKNNDKSTAQTTYSNDSTNQNIDSEDDFSEIPFGDCDVSELDIPF